MNFLKPNKLKIILTTPLFVLGVYFTFSFAVGMSLSWNTTIADALLAGSFVDTFFELLSLGGITGLILGNFLAVFTPVVVLIAVAGIFQLVWSYFLSCLIVFFGKKLFATNQ